MCAQQELFYFSFFFFVWEEGFDVVIFAVCVDGAVDPNLVL